MGQPAHWLATWGLCQPLRLGPAGQRPSGRGGARPRRFSPPVNLPAVRSPPEASPRQGGPNSTPTAASGAQEQAHRRPWRCGGAARRRPAISGRDVARGVAGELYRVSVVLVRVERGREVERRGGVHGAELSSELDHYSGEGFPRKGSFPGLTEASTACAR